MSPADDGSREQSSGDRERRGNPADGGRLTTDGGTQTASVIDAVLDAVVVFDETNRVTRVNPAFESLFDVVAGRIEGASVQELADWGLLGPPSPRRDGLIEAVAATDTSRIGVEIDPTATPGSAGGQPDGGTRTVEAQVAPLADGGTVVTIRDVTERRRTEAALEGLHETAQSFTAEQEPTAIAEIAVDASQQLIDLQQTGIYLYDERTDRLTPAAVTDELEALIGDPPVFSGGESLAWEVYQTGDSQIHTDLRTVSGRYRDQTPIRSELLLPLDEFGVLITGSTQPNAFADWQVSVARVLAADTTRALERAAREAELRARQSELERQNDRLDAFVSIVSHDLRNPLNVASGNLELARLDDDPDRIDAAEAALDRAADIVDDVLTIARDGQAVKSTEVVDLDALSRKCWTAVATTDATLTFDDPPRIRADPSRLRHLLENLFANSVEHGPGDGTASITVTVGRTDDGFFVADDGVGLPDPLRDSVLGTEETTANGIGLDIARQMAEAHGWQLRGTEAASGGARFELVGVEIAD